MVTLFEHQVRSYDEIGLYATDSARRDRVLTRLERINDRAGLEILHLGRKGLRANALVGVVSAGDFVFEILPKIDWEPDHNAAGIASRSIPWVTASANLMAMLSYAYDLHLYEQDITGLDTQPASWLEILTRLFAVNLHREILSGLPQEYINREEKLSILRGRWDIQRQLKHPGQERSTFDVIYDDLSPDFPLNQVFRFVVEQLRSITQDPGSQSLLADLSAWFHPVARLNQVTPDILEKVQFNRLNERFQAAFHLACLFLSGSAIQLAAGSQLAYAFVFDMNMLFERFIAGFLARYRREILPASWQDISILSQSAGTAWYLGRSEGKNLLRIRPDLVFLLKNQPAPLLVMDTKYKQLVPSHRKSGTSPEDIYQMIAYAVRLKCSLGLLLYPQFGNNPIRKQIDIPAAGCRLSIATINLHTPLSQPLALTAEMHEIFQI